MKKLLIVAALVTANIAPAHAISEAYRRQLQREHKTQQSEISAAPVKAPAEYKPGHYKPIHVHAHGIDFKRSRDGFAYINGSLAANDETTSTAQVYSAGLITVAVYNNGRINAMEDGRFLGKLN